MPVTAAIGHRLKPSRNLTEEGGITIKNGGHAQSDPTEFNSSNPWQKLLKSTPLPDHALLSQCILLSTSTGRLDTACSVLFRRRATGPTRPITATRANSALKIKSRYYAPGAATPGFL